MSFKYPLVGNFPASREIRHKLGDALREVELLRSLLRLAERAERYRQRDLEIAEESCGFNREEDERRRSGRSR